MIGRVGPLLLRPSLLCALFIKATSVILFSHLHYLIFKYILFRVFANGS